MIPDAKKDAVTTALRQAFGVSEFEDIEALTAGLSTALVFRIVVRGCSYLLRVITRTDAINNPTRQFACMQSAAKVGLAPRVWYTSIEDRISITDFVSARPFPRAEALVLLPSALRAVHALPPFPRPTTVFNYLDAVDGFMRRFQAAKILPDSETDELFLMYSRLTGVYPREDSEMVSCHNDLKPENILFDGDRVWLVDWEAAFINDRYVDLAVAANFLVTNDAEEDAFLRAYFNEAPGEYRFARFYLMRQILHLLYVVVFMIIGSAGKPIDPDGDAPAFRDFHERIWAGEVSLASVEAKLQYARTHRNQALQNQRTARFQQALQTVSKGI
jgi:aminoglycoside phosphotransferase (APT) family kinase protein